MVQQRNNAKYLSAFVLVWQRSGWYKNQRVFFSPCSRCEKIADFYQNLGIKEVIIKNGSKGAYIRSGNESFEQPGFKVEKVVDTVGAGDGFAAGVLSGKLEGLSIRECAIRGNAIGAIQVTYSSDNEGLPTQDELKKFIEKRI